MSPVTMGIIGIVILLVLFFMELPVGIAMLLVGFVGVWCIAGLPQAFHLLCSVPYKVSFEYLWSLIPLFVFMGQLSYYTGLSTDLFSVAFKWLGHFRGGMAMTTIGTSTGFGAVCGDNIAGAVTMTAVCLPEMRKHKYADTLSLGSICAGGILSFLIPPSLGFIMFGILADESIGTLFIAGIFPGILTALIYIVTIFIICRIDPKKGPAGPKFSWRERIVSLKNLWGMVLLVIIVFGGIYSGFISPTEAGALGAFAAIIVGLAKRRLTWKGFSDAILSSVETTGMVFLLLVGAFSFAPFLSLTRIPAVLVVLSSGWAPWLVLLFVLVFYFVGGLIFDSVVLMVITVPIFVPMWMAAGFNFVWLGVVVMLIVCLGAFTPPVGLVVYAVSGMVPDAPVSDIFKGVLPFIPAVLVCIALVIVFPQIAMFLPNLAS